MDRELLQFRLKGYSPETLPMWRLAEYLSQLSALYGARDSVHFDKLLKGSAIVQTWVPRTEAESVVARVRSAQLPDPPEEVKRAYQRIDSMLRENQASAEIRRRNGAKILAFPGAKLVEPPVVVVTEYAEVEGVVVRVGGVDKTIPVHLQAGNGDLLPCQVRDRALAKTFAPMLYGDPIRVRGPGQWERTPDGCWKLLSMTIEGWDVLEPGDVVETFQGLREIAGNGWKKVKDPERELQRIREGK